MFFIVFIKTQYKDEVKTKKMALLGPTILSWFPELRNRFFTPWIRSKYITKHQQDNFLQSSSIAFGSPITQKVFSYITTNVTDWEKQQAVKKKKKILINLVF